jgi:hypothetical protein
MSPVASTPADPLKRQYPHVDAIADWRAQQSIRLLWDRVFDLESRLQAAEATQGDLVSAANDQETELARVRRAAGEALAIAQHEGGKVGTPGEPAREPTIPDYSDIVATVLARYNPVVPAADEEAGKAQLTRAVAWEIYQTDPNIGLLFKDYGNQVLNFSVDLIVQQTNGDIADVASSHNNGDGTVTITAIWGPHAGDDDLRARWRQPTLALAETAGPMTLL